MEYIKLTEEQQEKLIKMANKLFPDTKWHFWESEDDDYPMGQMMGYNKHATLGKHKDIQSYLEIHWLEFCLYHLTKALYGNELSGEHCLGNITRAQYEAARIVSHPHIHPIDWLYEDFKKR